MSYQSNINDDRLCDRIDDARFHHGCVPQSVCNRLPRRSCACGCPCPCSRGRRRSCACGCSCPCSPADRRYGTHVHRQRSEDNSTRRYVCGLLSRYILQYCICRGCAPRSAYSHRCRRPHVHGGLPGCIPAIRRYGTHVRRQRSEDNSTRRYVCGLLSRYILQYCICRGCAPRSAYSRRFRRPHAHAKLPDCTPAIRRYDTRDHRQRSGDNNTHRCAYGALYRSIRQCCICRGYAPRPACSRQCRMNRVDALPSVYIPKPRRRRLSDLPVPHPRSPVNFYLPHRRQRCLLPWQSLQKQWLIRIFSFPPFPLKCDFPHLRII